MTPAEDEAVEFANLDRHRFLANSRLRDVLKWVLFRLSPEVRQQIITHQPPILVISCGASPCAVRLPAATGGLIAIVLPSYLEVRTDVTERECAGVLAHELAHCLLAHLGVAYTDDQELEADALAADWSFGQDLLKHLCRLLEDPPGFDLAPVSLMKHRVARLSERIRANP